MGRLPKAVEGSKAQWPQELVVPRDVHDELKGREGQTRREIGRGRPRKGGGGKFLWRRSAGLPRLLRSQLSN
jgi:hypothetical protein